MRRKAGTPEPKKLETPLSPGDKAWFAQYILGAKTANTQQTHKCLICGRTLEDGPGGVQPLPSLVVKHGTLIRCRHCGAHHKRRRGC